MNKTPYIDRVERMEIIGNAILSEFIRKKISMPDGIGSLLIILAKEIVYRHVDKTNLLLALEEMIQLVILQKEREKE